MAANVEITVMNQKFVLKRGTASEAYIREIARYVNDKMHEIQEKTQSVATVNVAILAALNIADELFKKRDEQTRIKKEIGRELDQTIAYIQTELNLH